MNTVREQPRTGPSTSDRLKRRLPDLRVALERERQFRLEQLTALAPLVRAPVDPWSSEQSPEAGTFYEVGATLAAGARRALGDIDCALSRMDTGEYGVCEHCGDQISCTILEAIPQTATCLGARCREHALDTATPGLAPQARGELSKRAPEMSLKGLLGRSLRGPDNQHLGHIHDVVAKAPLDPHVMTIIGIVATLGGVLVFAPSRAVGNWQDSRIRLTHSPRLRYQLLPGEVLLAQQILGLPVLPPTTGQPARITDLGLCRTGRGWMVWSVDTRGPIGRLLRRPCRPLTWAELVGDRITAHLDQRRHRGPA